MLASLISGKEVAALKKIQIKERIKHHIQNGHSAPGLAVVLIGSDPASFIYVNNKRKACEEVGITSHYYNLPAETSQEELVKLINDLNHKEEVNGILIQLPLPKHIDTPYIIEQINPQKDVDGFHPYNLGRLAQRNPLLRPCTPLGIMNLLKHYQLDVQGKHSVVVGVSNIVGRPMSLELLMAGATVTMCHRFTADLKQFIARADLIIIATGVMDVVPAEWLKEHQIVIDVGIHRLADQTIRGDVDLRQALHKVAWITPVPGGVGPMTIASLLENTLLAAEIP
jgi:methylenetetrahydrofolate dehydrogenase (NADP+)/methenyltetrahydrofolate cyclohydrolase